MIYQKWLIKAQQQLLVQSQIQTIIIIAKGRMEENQILIEIYKIYKDMGINLLIVGIVLCINNNRI